MSDLVGNPEDRFSHNEVCMVVPLKLTTYHCRQAPSPSPALCPMWLSADLLLYNGCLLSEFTKMKTGSNFYRNDPMFPDRLVWANIADPDQTAPLGAV